MQHIPEKNPEYVVRHNGEVIATSSWTPLAEAAWHRATRDQAAGGLVELLRDGRTIATHRVVGGRGAAWPDGPASDMRTVVKAVIQLLRSDDWDARQIAEAMTKYGLRTSRARIDGMRGSAGRSVDVCAAEIATMLYAVTNEYKQSEASGDS